MCAFPLRAEIRSANRLKRAYLPLIAGLVPLGRANDLFRVEFADQFVENLLQQPILARLRTNVGEKVLALRLRARAAVVVVALGRIRSHGVAWGRRWREGGESHTCQGCTQNQSG
jgi:hypothetical protein